jgi:hypothetical protein
MGKLPLIAAAVAGALWAFPASAGEVNTNPAITLAQLDVCVGPDCRERGYRENERRYYGRDDDWRYRRGYGYRGCRDVTIRERRGDEVVVRHVRRCD